MLAALHKETVTPAMNSSECEDMDDLVKRGDIFYADLSPVIGS